MSILSAFSHLWPKCVASDNPSHSNLRRQLVRTLYWRINLEPRLHIWLLLILLLPCVWNVSSRPNCRHILFQFIFSKYFYVPAAFFCYLTMFQMIPQNHTTSIENQLRKTRQQDLWGSVRNRCIGGMEKVYYTLKDVKLNKKFCFITAKKGWFVLSVCYLSPQWEHMDTRQTQLVQKMANLLLVLRKHCQPNA